MGGFKRINDRDDIKVSDRWHDAAVFKNKNPVRTHKGHEYRLISKKERDFTVFERILRGTMGVFAVIGTFGLGFLNKNFKNAVTKLFTKEKKMVRYGALETTKELEHRLIGTHLVTKKEVVHQLVKDYMTWIHHISINHQPVDTTLPNFAINRGSKHPELEPDNLNGVIPQELQTFFGDDYPANAEILGFLLQQGMSAELEEEALRRLDDTIILRDSNGEIVDRGPDVTVFSYKYPDYEFSKVGDEFFVTVKTKGYYQQHPICKSENYVVSKRINLTNRQEEITTTFTKVPFTTKSKAEFLDELLEGTSLNTEEGLIKRLQVDYSAISGHIKLNNKVVDMGTPAFAENRGTGVTPPDTLEEMFPEEMRAYFPEGSLPSITLLIQQGISDPLTQEAAKLIDIPAETGFTLESYPHFEFSKKGDVITLLIKTKARIYDINNNQTKEHYSIEMSMNLTKPDSMVKTEVVKD